MKKILTFVLVLSMLLMLTACAKAGVSGDTTGTTTARPSGAAPTETEGSHPTEPLVTEPPATQPLATQPPVTEPIATEPPATEPPATEPLPTEPPATEPPVHSHSYTETVTAPTCTTKGYSTYTCACGDSYTEKETAALGHSFGQWTIVQTHSCTQDEIQEGKCACGAAERTVTRPAGHDYDESNICRVCGDKLVLTFALNSDGKSYCVVKADPEAEGVVVIPESYQGLPVTAIGDNAFSGDTITGLVIPTSITFIDTYAFRNSSFALKDVYYLGDLEQWMQIDIAFCGPCYYGANLYLKGELLTDLVFPEGMTTAPLYSGSFWGCGSLTSITFPDSVTKIQEDAFRECINLTKVTLGKNVKTIGYYAFHYCLSLKEVSLPEGLTTIEHEAFQNCTSLTELTIPASVTELGYCAFNFCSALEKITYKGTMAQWQALTKGVELALQQLKYTVICTDGEISQ